VYWLSVDAVDLTNSQISVSCRRNSGSQFRLANKENSGRGYPVLSGSLALSVGCDCKRLVCGKHF
jgi:hypothetical protein